MLNKGMSRVRKRVEWALQDLKKLFTPVEFPRKMKLCMVSVAMVYIVLATLCNFRTCLSGSETSNF